MPPQHALLNFAFAFIFSTKYQDLLKEDYDSKHYFTINKGRGGGLLVENTTLHMLSLIQSRGVTGDLGS